MSDDKLFDEFRKLVLDAEMEGVEDSPPNDDEALKDELIRQNREQHFGADDHRSDDELWQAAMKDEQFKAALRGEGGVVTAETKPTLEYLANEILHLYDDEAAALEELENETRARRERFREAKATLARTAAEASEAIAEMEGLGSRLAQADLESDEEGKNAVRGRHAALKASVKGIEEERREALEVFRHGDPWQTASAAYQTAGAVAEAVMRRAEEQRTELREALDKAFRDLDEKADRVRQFAKTHNTLRR